MEKVNYADSLPNPNIDAADAIEALTEKIPRFEREGWFDETSFVEVFYQRVVQIMNRLPEEETKRKPLEIELAYLINDLDVKYGIIISNDVQLMQLRSIKRLLENAGVFEQYRSFGKGDTQEVDVGTESLFKEYLDYLYIYSNLGIRQAQEYLETCIRISQVNGLGMDILLDHLGFLFDQIPQKTIDALLEKNDYLGGKEGNFDIHVKASMEDGEISRDEAIEEVMGFQRDAAAFHTLLGDFYNENIDPHINELPTGQVSKIRALLNDLRDIVDPEGYVPLYFHDGNWLETLMRMQIEDEGREVH